LIKEKKKEGGAGGEGGGRKKKKEGLVKDLDVVGLEQRLTMICRIFTKAPSSLLHSQGKGGKRGGGGGGKATLP